MAIPGVDPDVEQFVQKHILIIAGPALTVFLAGVTVGRFWLERLTPVLRAQAAEFKNQRDEARLQLQQANLRVQQTTNGKDKDIEAEKEASRSRAVSRFFSALVTILILALLGYSVYEQSLIRGLAQAEAVRNAEFQSRTDASLKALQPKPPPPPKPAIAPKSAPTPVKKVKPETTESQQ